MMRLCFLFILFVIVNYHCQAQVKQVIDTSNYYNYYSTGGNLAGNDLKTCWLSNVDIIPVLIEELKSAGYEEIFDNQLYQLPGKQMLVLSAYCYNEDFGFVYSQGHDAFPLKNHRKRISRHVAETGYEYVQDYYQNKSNLVFQGIKKLPHNIFILQEDCYWYQFTEDISDNKKLVTKEDIVNVLRQDIRGRIAKAPNAKH